MGSGSSGFASGVILALLGAFLILRTVVKDDRDQNLVDRIMGL